VKVIEVNVEQEVIAVKGAVPGARNSFVVISS
jgi:ribosomal protein L3